MNCSLSVPSDPKFSSWPIMAAKDANNVLNVLIKFIYNYYKKNEDFI